MPWSKILNTPRIRGTLSLEAEDGGDSSNLGA